MALEFYADVIKSKISNLIRKKSILVNQTQKIWKNVRFVLPLFPSLLQKTVVEMVARIKVTGKIKKMLLIFHPRFS